MTKRTKVVMAMSGGVDSSVGAALLKERGFDVVGVFMKFWAEPPAGDSARISAAQKTDLYRYENRCCSTEAENRARQVAKILKIPFYVFNFGKEFKKRIVDSFLRGHKEGITPNPCVVCNKEIKFGLLLEKALKLDADYIATGHYARIKAKGAKLLLLKGRDKNKDQSYFLWQLNKKQLKRILFPVGNYTKPEVRRLAKKFKLPVLNVKESMEICFVPGKLEDFLKRHIKTKSGQILTAGGKRIGEHQGLAFYTIGQRKGIELSGGFTRRSLGEGGPYYVAAKDKKKNALIVASFLEDEILYSKNSNVKNINWTSGKKPKLPLKVTAQIRYGHQPVRAVISEIKNSKHKIRFQKPQRAITPGQSVVFYRDEELLGGGIIDK